MNILIIFLTGLGGLIVGLIIGYFWGRFTTKARRNRKSRYVGQKAKRFIEYTQNLRKLEERKFRSFAIRRIKEDKKFKIDEFQFKYNSPRKQNELLEEMYFIAFALKYLKENKLALIDEFEFKHVPPERQAKLLETYRNR